jgi:hypothetical protein
MSEVQNELLITLVHGTWGRGLFPNRRRKGRRPFWFEERSLFFRDLSEQLDDIPHKIKPLLWSGKNSIFERDKAARVLADYLSAEHIEHPQATQLIIAHSHGGNIALRALDHLQKRDASQLYGAQGANPLIATLATPFIEVHQANFGHRPFYIRLARMMVMLVLLLSLPVAVLFVFFPQLMEADLEPMSMFAIFFIVVELAIGLMVTWLVFGRATARQNQLDALKEATRLREVVSAQRLLVIRAIDDEASLAMAVGAIANYLTATSILFVCYLFFFLLPILSMDIIPVWALRALVAGVFALIVMLFGAFMVSRTVHGRELAVSPIECQINTQSAPDAIDLSGVITLVSRKYVKSLRHGIYEHENCAKAISDWVRSQLGGGKSTQLFMAVDKPYAIPRASPEAALDRLHDMAAELIGGILATFNRAPAKLGAGEPVKTDGALVWKDLGSASVSGDHHAFEAPAATGKYRITPIDIFDSRGFGFGGYAVEHQPSDNPEDFKRRRRLKSGVQRPEQAKAIAQQDHDRGGDAS